MFLEVGQLVLGPLEIHQHLVGRIGIDGAKAHGSPLGSELRHELGGELVDDADEVRRGLVAPLEGEERRGLLVHVHPGDPVALGLQGRDQVVLGGAARLEALPVRADRAHQAGDEQAVGAGVPRAPSPFVSTVPVAVCRAAIFLAMALLPGVLAVSEAAISVGSETTAAFTDMELTMFQ